MLKQPTDQVKHRLALTAEAGAAVVLAVLATALAVQHESTLSVALAVIMAVGCASFVVDATRRVRRTGKD